MDTPHTPYMHTLMKLSLTLLLMVVVVVVEAGTEPFLSIIPLAIVGIFSFQR